MSGLSHDLDEVGAVGGGAGREARSETVTGEVGRVQASSFGGTLHDQRDALRRQAVADIAVPVDAPESGTVVYARAVEPRAKSAHRTRLSGAPERDADELSCTFLVGLAAADRD